MLFPYGRERVKRTILKGVYEENLQVFHGAPRIARSRSWSRSRKSLVMSLALVGLLFGHSAILDSTIQPQYDSAALIWEAGETGRLKHFLPAGQKGTAVLGLSSEGVTEEWAEPQMGGTSHPALRDEVSLPVAAPPEIAEDLLTTALPDGPVVPLRKMFGLGVRTIVIDPGHGGADPGTAGKMGLQEKHIVLDVARRLKERLDRYGQYEVLLTRDADVTLTLNERIAFANSHHADLFLSIHVNYLPARPNSIIETYYFGLSEDEDALKLAMQENAQSAVGLGEFREMTEKMGGTLKFQESVRLASSIQENLFANISRTDSTVLDRGIKKAPFLVIMGTEMPGVLAEVTCLSNKEEEVKLRTPGYRDDIASYLEAGILDYLNKGDYVYEARR